MMNPSVMTDVVGIIMMAVVLVIEYTLAKKENAAMA
jgi:hypothetical protein